MVKGKMGMREKGKGDRASVGSRGIWTTNRLFWPLLINRGEQVRGRGFLAEVEGLDLVKMRTKREESGSGWSWEA